jgi:putative oxidoreductase
LFAVRSPKAGAGVIHSEMPARDFARDGGYVHGFQLWVNLPKRDLTRDRGGNMVGFLKVSGDAQLVGLFEAIGLGQWFRYLTGALEVAGAFLLLIPRTSGLGALLLAVVMVGAVVTHVFIVGGSPLMAIIRLVVTGVVAWGRRQRTMNLLTR